MPETPRYFANLNRMFVRADQVAAVVEMDGVVKIHMLSDLRNPCVLQGTTAKDVAAEIEAALATQETTYQLQGAAKP